MNRILAAALSLALAACSTMPAATVEEVRPDAAMPPPRPVHPAPEFPSPAPLPWPSWLRLITI